MIDPQKLQVLLDVLQRAPVTRAEQLVIQEVIDQLIALATPATDESPTNGAHTEELPKESTHA